MTHRTLLAVMLVSLVLCTALPSLAVSRGILLNRDPSPPQVVYNDGTGTITFDWTVTFGTVPANPQLLQALPPSGPPIALATPSFGASPSIGSFTWTVPLGTQTGNWYGRMTFYSNWCALTPFEDQAQVGFIVSGAGRLRFYKFDDADGDGNQEAGEPPLAGWRFTIKDCSTQAVIASGVTDASGQTPVMALPMQPDGASSTTYCVHEDPPVGDSSCWFRTTPCPGPSSQDFTVVVPVVTVADPLTTLVVGNWHYGNVRFNKFQDDDGDGTKDPNEPLLAGWKFSVRNCANNAEVAAGTTGPDGLTPVLQVPMMPGNAVSTMYCVRENPPAGDQSCWVRTTPDPGLASANFTVTVPATCPGAPPTSVVVGNGHLGLLQFTKYQDDNGDGVRDPNELPLAGWTFTVRNCSTGAVVATGVTGANGQTPTMVVPMLPAGALATVYCVQETPPPGNQSCWLRTTPNPGPTSEAFTVTVAAGCPSSLPTCVVVGNWQPRFRIIKFCDDDSDCCRDDCESCLSGWVFHVTKPDGSTCDVTTCVGGSTPIVSGPEGDYSIEEELEPGWKKTTQNGINPFPVIVDDCEVDDVIVGNTPVSSERQCNLPVTLTQQDWHNLADPNTPGIPGGVLFTKFRYAFAEYQFYGETINNKLVVGKRNRITFSSTTGGLTRLWKFLPQTGSAASLKYSYTEPGSTPAGALAGEVIALEMNVFYNDRRLMPRFPGYDLEKFVVTQGPFIGRTVGYVLDTANRVLGGDSPAMYVAGLDHATLVQALQAINANYQMSDINSFHDRGYLRMDVPQGTRLPPTVPHVP